MSGDETKKAEGRSDQMKGTAKDKLGEAKTCLSRGAAVKRLGLHLAKGWASTT